MKKFILGLIWFLTVSSQAFASNIVHWHGSKGAQFAEFAGFDEASAFFYSKQNQNLAAVLIDENGLDVRTFGGQYWTDVILGNAIRNGHLEIAPPQAYYVVQATPGAVRFLSATDSRKAAVDAYNAASDDYALAFIENGVVTSVFGGQEYYLWALGVWYRTYKL